MLIKTSWGMLTLALALSLSGVNISFGQDGLRYAASGSTSDPSCNQAAHAKPARRMPLSLVAPGRAHNANSLARLAAAGTASIGQRRLAAIGFFHGQGNFPIPPTGCGYYSLADHLHGNLRPKRQPSGYAPFALMAPSFFDANFTYLESIGASDQTFVERMKRIPIRLLDVQHGRSGPDT